MGSICLLSEVPRDIGDVLMTCKLVILLYSYIFMVDHVFTGFTNISSVLLGLSLYIELRLPLRGNCMCAR